MNRAMNRSFSKLTESTRLRRILSLSLACMLVLALAPLSIVYAAETPGAASDAIFHGVVLDGNSAIPMSEVIVHLVAPDGKTSYSAQPSDESGAFKLKAPPAENYRVVAETERGAYLTPHAVQLQPGVNAPVSVSLQNQAGANFQTGGGGGSEGSLVVENGPWKRWGRWAVVGGIALAAVVLLEEVSEDLETNATRN